MKEDGRIVNISSVASGLSQYSEDIRQRFRNSNMKLEDLEDLVKQYQVCLKDCYYHLLREKQAASEDTNVNIGDCSQ